MKKLDYKTFCQFCLKYLVFLCLFLSCADYAMAQDLAAGIDKIVPLVKEKLYSNDIHHRISVLQYLVVENDEPSCTTFLKFKYKNLPSSDYSFVVKRILEGDLDKIDQKLASETWWRLHFVITHFNFKEFAGPLAAYLPKVNSGIKWTIFSLLETLDAIETADAIAPFAGVGDRSQRNVVNLLVKFKSKKAIPSLLLMLKSSNELDRYYGLKSLVEVGGKQAVSQIAELILDSNENNRYWALETLVKLDAHESAPHFWKLVNTRQRQNTEAYAIAALISFGHEHAIPLAVERILEKSERGGEMLEFLVKLKAKTIIPSLIAILEGKIGKTNEIYDYIIYKLGELEAYDAIPILRSYARRERGNEDTCIMAIQTLGVLEAREAVNDLLLLLDPKENVDGGRKASTIMALAEIGERRTWRVLLDFAADPSCSYSDQIIIKLNRHLDAELWQKTHEKVVSHQYIVSIKEIVETYTKETGISIRLHFEPGKDFAKRAPLSPPLKDTKGYPWANLGGTSLNDALHEIPRSISDGTLPQNFTFIFDDKEIHILTVEKAIAWWRSNILSNETL